MPATRYHHGNLRQALADAAVEAAREQGPDGLAVRELARRVGVSHNAAYRHFADRDALVEVVAEHALAGLVTAMEARLARVEGRDGADPVRRARRRLVATGLGYVDYAMAEPGLFRVLFAAYPAIPDKAGRPDPYGLLNLALDDLVAVGYLDPQRRIGADLTCWSAVHGFSVLCTEGPLRGIADDERDAALAAMLDTLDAAYGVPAPAAADSPVDRGI